MSAVLAVWNDVDPANEPEFDEWYVREHVPERVGVPGFRNGRRHVAVEGQPPGTPRDFTFYEVDRLAVLTSAPYRERLDDPTPWTRRTMPWFVDMTRAACVVQQRFGVGHGGGAGTVRFSIARDARAGFARWLEETVFPALAELPGVSGAQHWTGDLAATAVESTERGLRRGDDAMVEDALLVTARDPDALRGAGALLGPQALSDAGASAHGGWQIFRTVYTLHRDELALGAPARGRSA